MNRSGPWVSVEQASACLGFTCSSAQSEQAEACYQLLQPRPDRHVFQKSRKHGRAIGQAKPPRSCRSIPRRAVFAAADWSPPRPCARPDLRACRPAPAPQRSAGLRRRYRLAVAAACRRRHALGGFHLPDAHLDFRKIFNSNFRRGRAAPALRQRLLLQAQRWLLRGRCFRGLYSVPAPWLQSFRSLRIFQRAGKFLRAFRFWFRA